LEFLRRYNVSVTLLNLNVGELSEPDEHFGCVIGDARQLAFEDGEFDLVHSNSVIEHVGAWQDMEAFASETRRVGRSYYVQTPYFWFPVDPHFYGFPMFHWLPRQAKAWLLANLPLATAGKLPTSEQALHAVDSVKLLDGHQLRRLFPDAGIQFELLAGLPKSLIAVRKQTKARSGA
jgi:2-polyprenyl-3-methyl-5-hydroxy-6-metoxy-1,4-benzoquinol methylase